MKNLTLFAFKNPKIAQISIAVLLVIAGSGAYHGGVALFALEGLSIPILALPLLIGCMYAVGKIYYAAGPLSLHKSVIKKRTFTISLFVCWLFCFVAGNRTAYMGMQDEQQGHDISTAKGQLSMLVIEGTSSQKAKNWFKWFTTKKKAVVKKEVDYFMTKRLKAGEMGDWGKFFLTLLLIAAYIFIAGLVLAFSCSLSCDGQETAAVIVLILGLGLSSWGLIAALVAIFRKRSNGNDPTVPDPSTPRRGPSKKEKM